MHISTFYNILRVYQRHGCIIIPIFVWKNEQKIKRVIIHFNTKHLMVKIIIVIHYYYVVM